MLQRRPRTPGVVFAVVSLVLLIVIGALALTARQQPPPTIAEFAPQAIENISDAPEDQSSSSGTGKGTGGAGGAPASPTPDSGIQPIERARVRRCVGEPPRQIEDPQSPPCVPFWEGDNFGATSRGVTRDQINIASSSNYDDIFSVLFRFFNQRFEFYGRQLILKEFTQSDDATPASHQAAAVEVESQQAFGVVYTDEEPGGYEGDLHDQLADRNIVTVNVRPTPANEAHMQRHHPYQWNYPQSWDQISDDIGDWACAALRNKPAEFASGNEKGKPRVFGMVYAVTSSGTHADVGDMERALGRCGIKLAAKSDYSDQGNATLQMKTAGVTTVICICDGPGAFAAASQDYHPEWIVTHQMTMDSDTIGRSQIAGSTGQDQIHIFGPWSWNKFKPISQEPWHWAINETEPGYVYKTHELDYKVANEFYLPLLVMASGIQMAGPRLTPETFARGLQQTKFPNPGADGPPFYQAHIGFGPNDHSAQDTVAISWLSETESSPWDGAPGTWCYAALGTRWGRLAGRVWPTDYQGLYTGQCW